MFKVPQRGNQDGTDSEPAATGKVHVGVALCVVTKQNLSGANAFRRDAGVGLQMHAEIGSGSPGSGAAHNVRSLSQGDGSAAGASEALGALGNHADSRFQVE